MSAAVPKSLDDLLGDPPSPPNGANSNVRARAAVREREGGITHKESGKGSAARAQVGAPVRVDSAVGAWDLQELMAELDPSDEAAMRQFYCRSRIAEIVNLGLCATRLIDTKRGLQEIPDTATRAFYHNFIARHFIPKPEKQNRRKEEPQTQAQTETGFLESMRGRPAVRKRIIALLQAMDEEERQ